ncbi:MAG: geranylgeranyl reductase family protein [Candidatus Micrarchaeia archaeon]
MSYHEFDIIVVGGGPGGSATAALTARKGWKVLLLDKAKFPRDKTCGDAVSGKSLKVLRELGVVKEIEKAPHADITGVVFSNPKGTMVEIPFPKTDSTGAAYAGYCCRREVLDNILFRNAKKEVAEARENFLVTDLLFEGGRAVGVKGTDLKTKAQKEFRSKIVVGADGATSVVARALGRETQPEEHSCVAARAYYKNVKGLTGNIEIHFVESLIPGYFWIFPLDDGLANVGVGMVTSEMKARKVNLRQSMFDIIEKHPVFKERFAGARLASEVKGWTLPFGSRRRKPHAAGALLVGDAAALVDPFTGEGMGNAMSAGKLASEVIDRALKAGDVSEGALAEYEAALHRELDPELQMNYKLQRLGKHRLLLNLIIDKAARSREIRETISTTFTDVAARGTFSSPLFLLRLLLA